MKTHQPTQEGRLVTLKCRKATGRSRCEYWLAVISCDRDYSLAVVRLAVSVARQQLGRVVTVARQQLGRVLSVAWQ